MNPDPNSSENHPASDENLLALGKGALRSGGGGRPAQWQPPAPEELQTMLPPGYGIIRILGRGGMGAVYLARQLSLDRLVAIKILPDDLDEAGLSFAERFKNEARAMAQLSHPGIVAVFDFGQTEVGRLLQQAPSDERRAGDSPPRPGLLYIVMEYIEGTDVAQMIINQGRLHSAHAMAIVAHVCDALAYAHARGIIHRDIKPSNIMISSEGVVKVADFGLAKMNQAGQSTGLTQSGMVMGTLHFMAPEALTLGSAVDQRADIYAVGVMLYQMLTGKLPQGLFEMPSLQIPGLDPRYDGIVARALREDRALRYQNAIEMRHDLDAILTQPVVKADAKETPAPAATRQAQAASPLRSQPQRQPGQVYRPPQRSSAAPVKKKSSIGIVLTGLAVVAAAIGAFILPRSKDVSTGNSPRLAGDAQQTADDPQQATKDKPFVNSLGMKFAPVPITGGRASGEKVLFSIWETRVQDYDAFVMETRRPRTKPDYEQAPAHPATVISWEDATAFCTWLTSHERAAGKIGAGELYRLPSDHEWSCAVGIGAMETPAKLPADKDQKIARVFPWGSSWPPKAGEGNYGGEELEPVKSRHSYLGSPITGYRDDHVETSPAGSYRPNTFGLFDLGGNVWEWCADWYDDTKTRRVLRGGSWTPDDESVSLSSYRAQQPPGFGGQNYGFRIVLASYDAKTTRDEPETTPASADKERMMASEAATALSAPRSFKAAIGNPATATKEQPFTNTLGMKFVPVPGARALFCIWETRVRDYEPFSRENPADAERKPPGWKGMAFDQGADHPAGAVRWSSARAFCEWLTKTERAAGQLPGDATYRLPMEAEWLRAAADELEHQAPDHPPGNFADEAFHRKTPDHAWIRGFDDGFAATSPVGSFAANRLGIHDLLGNVWEWCEEHYDPSVGGNRLLRGGACSETGFGRHGTGDVVDGDVGFRIVLELPASATATQAAPAPAPDAPATWTDTKGRSITATFKAIAGGSVLLNIAGKVTPVPLDTLSVESRNLARDYQQRTGAGSGATQPGGTADAKPAAPQPPSPAPQKAAARVNAAAGRIVICPLAESGNVSPVGAGAFDAKHKDTLFVDVAAFDHHVIAVTAAGEVVRWGSEEQGGPLKETPPVVQKRAVACSAARFRDFIVYEDSSLHVMGPKDSLSIPEGLKVTRTYQHAWSPGIYAKDDAGHLHFIGAGSDKAIYDVPASLKNVAVKDLKVSDHIVALTQEGGVVVWGRTGYDQLPLPADLQKGGKAIAIGVDGPTSFAVLTGGKVCAWGHLLNEWAGLIERARNAQDSWLLRDGYWAALIFPQAGPAGYTYEICAKDAVRNDYLSKILRRHRPIKLACTQDALILIESP